MPVIYIALFTIGMMLGGTITPQKTIVEVINVEQGTMELREPLPEEPEQFVFERNHWGDMDLVCKYDCPKIK